MPSAASDVLDRVVLVDVEVAAGDAVEIEAGVEREQREQMVEEADPRRDVRSAAAVERERDAERRLGARPDQGRLAAGRGPAASAPSARRRTSFSVGRRSVTRIPCGKRRTTMPCASSSRAEIVARVRDPDEVARPRRRVEAGRDERGADPLALGDLGVEVVARLAQRGGGDARRGAAIGAGARRASSTAAVAGAATA